MGTRVRLEDIAKECGVTKGLVSRALAGKYNVSDETRNLIVQKAAEMGYDNAHLRSRPETISRVLLVISSRIMSVGGLLSAGFDQIFNLYNPLVYDQVDILDTYIYRQTFKDLVNPGVGTAIGLFKSVVSFLLVVIVDRIAKLCGERGII